MSIAAYHLAVSQLSHLGWKEQNCMVHHVLGCDWARTSCSSLGNGALWLPKIESVPGNRLHLQGNNFCKEDPYMEE